MLKPKLPTLVVMGWTVLPQKRRVGVLIPSISECELIWRKFLYRGNHIKIKSLGWALIQYDWHPYKKRKFGQRHIEGRQSADTGRRRPPWARERVPEQSSLPHSLRRTQPQCPFLCVGVRSPPTSGPQLMFSLASADVLTPAYIPLEPPSKALLRHHHL